MRRIPHWVTNLRTLGLAALLIGALTLIADNEAPAGRWLVIIGAVAVVVALTAKPAAAED